MEQKQPNNAITVKQETVDLILHKVTSFQAAGELNLPAAYSPGNALKSAWLILQQTVDRNDKPVLSVCSRPSIANALLDMVVQGLNPAKKQCYFIAYGQTLTCQRSYFGSMAMAKQVSRKPIEEDGIIAQVVYDGDVFEYEIRRGKKIVTKHVQKIGNVDSTKILAAYAQIFYEDGTELTDIMTIDQIKKSWLKSKMNPNGEKSTHTLFTEEMCKRTVINRICKPVINSSSDKNLFIQAVRRSEEIRDEVEAEEEISEFANKEIIDVEPEPQQAAAEPKPVNGSGQQQTDKGPGGGVETGTAAGNQAEPGF